MCLDYDRRVRCVLLPRSLMSRTEFISGSKCLLMKKSHLVMKQDGILYFETRLDYPKVTLLKPVISTLNPLT